MTYRHLHFLPVAACLVLLATFLITYAIAAGTGHVEPGFPYISYSGNEPPESCIFGQFLNIAVCLAKIGCLSCLGLDIVANFQERSVFVVHYVAACICFFCGTVYFIMQTVITRRMKQQKLFHIRLLMCLILCVCCFSTAITGGIAMVMFNGADHTKWKPTDGGYVEHIVSAVSEWIISVIFCLFTLTFYSEFKEISMEAPILRKNSPDGGTTGI